MKSEDWHFFPLGRKRLMSTGVASVSSYSFKEEDHQRKFSHGRLRQAKVSLANYSSDPRFDERMSLTSQLSCCSGKISILALSTVQHE